MKQHSIPQDITGYRFHLIGSMTLRQFAELAVGAIFAFIVYKSNLVGVVKWPLFILIIIISIMIAFVPIEERPLDFWIVTFIKNLWKPTKFFWKRTPKIPDFFNYKPGQHQHLDHNPEVNYSPARNKRIQEFLKSMPENDEELDNWDIHYNQRAQELMASFDQIKVKPENISVQRQTIINKPMLRTRIRKLKNIDQIQEAQTQDGWPEAEVGSEDNSFETENSTTNQQHPSSSHSSANQLTGVVLDYNGQAVNGALIEVFVPNQDQALRIIKSDSSGQFFIKTALPNGEYVVKTEAEGLFFDSFSIKLSGKLIPAIKIIANKN